jgi:hypothetical protein
MSIVSSDLGFFRTVQPRKKRNFIAVQRAVPDSSIVSATPRQVPGFCVSKHIAKPFLYGDAPKSKMGVVPLKSLQEAAEYGQNVYHAPVYLIPAPLRHPIPQVRMFDVSSALMEMEAQPFQPTLEYNKGIRPAPRMMKGDRVEEPDAPFPTRTGVPAPAREVFGTFDRGKQDYSRLGY